MGLQIFNRLSVSLFHYLKELAQKAHYEALRRRYELDPSFRFNGESIEFYGPGRIVTGAGSYIGSHSTIQASRDTTVRIGRGCRISHYVRIYTSNLIPDQDMAQEPLRTRRADVVIGDHVWIGVGVFIREGVTIGDNSVVGANSVVTSDVPAFSIAAGSPAKVIRRKRNTGLSQGSEENRGL